MAAYAALVSLLNTIDQIKKHPRLFTSLNKKQIQPLVKKAGFLLEFIVKNNYGGSSNKEAEDVERQIASAAHAAEDIIESHIVNLIHDGSSHGQSPYYLHILYKFCLGCCVDTSRNTLDLQQKFEEMDALVEKAMELEEKQATHSRADALMETGESSTPPTGMVGLDDELKKLVDELTGNRHPSSLHAISIVGMGGVGKTTLAKNVYQNSYIMHHFHFRAWATVSEQHDAKNILSQLLSGLGKSTSGTEDELGIQLHKTLSGIRYLIVLDDVWSVGAWDSVKRYFLDNGKKSRVVLTTRLSNVATDCHSSLFKMSLLDDEKSWNLFCEKVSIQHGDWPSPHLEEIGKEIVKLCKGLALSIVVIGGLLRKAPRTVGQWEDVVRDIKSIGNSKEKQESLDVLSLSYSHLPPHLKPCFLFMGVFKEDSPIRVSNIVKLWVGEGFIKPNGGRVLEEIAEGYLNDLIDRNLVLVGRVRKNGGIGSCGIHDLLRDLCFKLSKQQHFFHQVTSYGEEVGSRDRRLVFHDYLSETELPHARSIMLRKYHHDPIVCRLVRVFDANIYAFPTELYGNVNLRYLAYEHIYDQQNLWKVPSSVSLVWNLQTLIIKESQFIVVVAPGEIWGMQQLRHVVCDKIYLPDPPRRNKKLILESLRTLKLAVNLRLSEVMIPNIKKLHLLYDRDLRGYDDSLIDQCVRNLGRLHELKSLNLSVENCSRVHTPDPKINRKLITFPSCLNKLTLCFVRLHWDDLTIIGSMAPLLQVLNLESQSVTKGERWSPIEGQFLHLKFLKIGLCNLWYWDADSSHFPALEKLILERFDLLTEIPKEIGEISKLKLIRVELCPHHVAISAVKIKQEQLDNQDNDDLQIQLLIDSRYLESFKKELETEELTLDNFQLEMYHD